MLKICKGDDPNTVDCDKVSLTPLSIFKTSQMYVEDSGKIFSIRTERVRGLLLSDDLSKRGRDDDKPRLVFGKYQIGDKTIRVLCISSGICPP
jgi:hypothetical protein